ncbi:hypothetical protein Glove_461g36 [Diversispora epigaea]|uniref:Uncharacterized protein n=1 Tax=Diversispora epigaea TaxID=1348612 RepID=A0A397GWH5_9GLOM|nr:hypothetical protein Glove_461g36 [Diversispora epigaea]
METREIKKNELDLFPSLQEQDIEKLESSNSHSDSSSDESLFTDIYDVDDINLELAIRIEIDTQLYSSQVYLYNIKSNQWVTTFTPTLPSKSLPYTVAVKSIASPGQKF